MAEQTPIEVNENPIWDQLPSAGRSALVALTAFALGRHWIAGDTATIIGVMGGLVWPIVAGQIKIRHRAKQLVSVASDPRVPDAVAMLK